MRNPTLRDETPYTPHTRKEHPRSSLGVHPYITTLSILPPHTLPKAPQSPYPSNTSSLLAFLDVFSALPHLPLPLTTDPASQAVFELLLLEGTSLGDERRGDGGIATIARYAFGWQYTTQDKCLR